MKQWFLGLSLRERYMVMSAAAVVVLFILYQLIWSPINNHYQKLQKNVSTASETVSWMKQAAKEVRLLRGNNAVTNRPQGKQFVLGMIDRSVKKAGLGAVMKRVQPEGQSGVRVWFESAVFDELIKWLATIQSEHGLRVNEINIEQTESVGLVNVRVFLES